MIQQWAVLPEAEYQKSLAYIQQVSPQLVPALQAARQQYLATSEGQANLLGPQATGVTQELLGGGMGLTPAAQAQAQQQFALISAELRRRAGAEQQGIEGDLLRRGMLRSSLYGQERAGVSQGLMQSLGQARIGTEQAAMQNQMGQIGMGLGAYDMLAGERLEGQRLALEQRRQKQTEKNSWLQNITSMVGAF